MKRIVKLFVLCALWSMASLAHAEEADQLAKLLKDKDPDVRRNAAEQLKEMGKQAKPAMNALIQALKDDKDLFVRRFAAKALGAIGIDAKVAVPALTTALHDGERDGKPELSEAAVEALGQMGPTAVAPLIEVLKLKSTEKPEKGKKNVPMETKDGTLRNMAAKALGGMGKDAKPAVSALTDLLKDRQARTEAAKALGNIGPDAKDALDTLKDAVKKKEKDKGFKQAVKDAVKQIEAQ